jgi:hypothetical protein
MTPYATLYKTFFCCVIKFFISLLVNRESAMTVNLWHMQIGHVRLGLSCHCLYRSNHEAIKRLLNASSVALRPTVAGYHCGVRKTRRIFHYFARHISELVLCSKSAAVDGHF